jgi:hypothetical protein
MNEVSDKALRNALGARILSEANDLKRTPDALASELGYSGDFIRAVVSGAATVEECRDVIQRMAAAYPIRLADLWVEEDDTDGGVRVMRAADSEAGARIFQRKDRDGALTNYYEYRDTAMSRLGPFKPEWIQPIRIVEDAAAENPDVAYNNGHLMHQMTFFIGGVNFYWEVGGEKHCAEMTTGDSNYITPFVPHSFTSRDPDDLGLIIAVTFSGAVRRALDDFSILAAEAADDLAGDLRASDEVFRTRLNRHLANESLSPARFSEAMAAEGIPVGRAADLAAGAAPTADEVAIMSDILAIRPQDLSTETLHPGEEVVLARAGEADWRPWPEGNAPITRLKPLARTRHQPGLKGFHAEAVSADDPGEAGDMCHGLFEYIYNYGDQPLRMVWSGRRETVLSPGDSACVVPMVPHRFLLTKEARDPARFFLVRVPGRLDDATLDEYARYAEAGRHRVIKETKRWF